MDRLVRTFTTRQAERLDGLRGVDDVVKLRLLLEEFVRYSAADPNLHKLMTHAASRASPELDRLVSDYLHDYFKMIAMLIEKAQTKGQFVDGDPNHLHYLFIGAATRIFMQSPEVERVVGRSPLDPDFVVQHVEACMRLFFVEKPSRRSTKTS
jgi:bifunctional ADP-heptose synthase (sugar kinase/adenylyltransferase)